MIELRKSGVVVDRGDVERLKAEFQERHCVRLPKLLEPQLLDFLLARMEQGPWRDKIHEGIGTEVVLDDLPALSMLHLLMNSQAFLNTVRQITDCHDITWCGGRVYRFIPGSGHHDSWHTDHIEGRLVAVSLNLSVRGYQGGLFQLRERKSKRMLLEVANTGWGDATLFRISGEFAHQVTDVTGSEPKTAFAGWFQSGQPDLLSRLHAGSPSLKSVSTKVVDGGMSPDSEQKIVM